MKNSKSSSCRRCEVRGSSTRSTPRGGKNHVKKPRSAKISPETEGPRDQLLNENAEDSAASVGFPNRSAKCVLFAQKTEENSHRGLPASLEEGGDKFSFKTNICTCENEENAELSDDEEVSGASCFQRVKAFTRETLLRLFKKRRNGGRKARLQSLPVDIQENIFSRLSLTELFRTKVVSKSCEQLAESDAFLRLRPDSGEGSFTAVSFFMKDNAWQCTGFDLQSKMWRRLPTLCFLPTPDGDLFKEYSVCGDHGLMCANVSKLPHKEDLVVFNLLSGETRKLPPMQSARNPVLVHITVHSATNAYKVVAAGSCNSGSVSRKVEVFNSQTMLWTSASDLPGPEFALNEHQTGVCVDGVLYFIAFLDGNGSKGVLAFDVEKGEWLEERSCRVPLSNMLHLVESEGKVYMFSEQEEHCSGAVEHCIDVLEFGDGGCELKNVMRVKHSGGRGLLVYPEYTCVPFGEGKLCVLNTIKRDGVIYDIQSGMQCEVLEEPPVNQRGDNFFSLNPVSFTLQPNFLSKP